MRAQLISVLMVVVTTSIFIGVVTSIPTSSSSSSGNVTNLNRIQSAETTSLRCGQLLNCSTTGGIFYKPFERVLPNERCVWTLAVSGATSYRLNIQYLGFDAGNNAKLSVAGFRHRDESVSHYFPTTTGELNIGNSNILVIVFASGAVPSQGFVLEFTAENIVNPPRISARSRHEINGSTQILLKHPVLRNYNYEANELSSFAFLPENNIFILGRRREILYTRISIESCLDFVAPYKFNGTSGQWTAVEKICDTVDYQVVSSDDIIFFLFHTDSSSQRAGFYLLSTGGC